MQSTLQLQTSPSHQQARKHAIEVLASRMAFLCRHIAVRLPALPGRRRAPMAGLPLSSDLGLDVGTECSAFEAAGEYY